MPTHDPQMPHNIANICSSYSVYIAILLALIIIIWFFFPETKNLTIEEVVAIFDGDGVFNNINAAAVDAKPKDGTVQQVENVDGHSSA
jgi:hypothetical protein